jgi:hypothetical protein
MFGSVRAVLFLLVGSLVCAQTQPAVLGADAGVEAQAGDSALPVVTFTLDFPQSQPEHYSIRVPAGGAAHYRSTGRISRASDDIDTFEFDFALSGGARDKIFRLAADAGHFQRDLDSHRKNLAFTGKKTLAYKDDRVSAEASFNYAGDAAARELTEMFQNLSTTLEFGRRLVYDHRYQKLALDEELKLMQQAAQDKTLVEVAAIQPILEKIVADHSVVNVARARAQQLLGSAR